MTPWPAEMTGSGSGAFLTHTVGLEQRTPGSDPRPVLEQRPALSLSHAAPDPELGVVVQRVGQTFGYHRTAHANLLGLLLGSPPDEEGIRLGVDTGSL